MAYDKIIAVRTRLDHCIGYVLNREKTDLAAVRDYIGNAEKTTLTEEQTMLETGLNCTLETACADMTATKRRWAKPGGVLGYHLIHSFAPGEVTPRQAHEIGVEFAAHLLGDRYEAVVSTHLDRDHLHCHILFNSVSFLDGRKYHNTFQDYFRDIRGISNEVSRAHGLSVIEPSGKGVHYAEWDAERQGKTTIRSLIRQDIDAAVSDAFTYQSLFTVLEKRGYTVKRGPQIQHTAVRPPGGVRFIRLDSLGADYTEEAIKRRLSAVRSGKTIPKQAPPPTVPMEHHRYKVCSGSVHQPRRKLRGFRLLYVRYLYLLGVRRPAAERQIIPFTVRQEVTRLHRYQRQFRFLLEYARYLEMQGDNPTYSPGNIALTMLQNPEATLIGTKERWKTLGRSVLDAEAGNGVKIFTRASFGKGYSLVDVFDVKQTHGREVKPPTLAEDSKEMETALTTLLNYAVVPVVVDGELNGPALYDEQKMELAINPDYPDSEAFPAIATEIAHCRFHAKGANPAYTREESELDAQSVSYILCKRFGVQRDLPDLSDLSNLYDGWTPQERRQALDSIQNMEKQIGGSIERGITPPQRSRTAPNRITR